MELSKSQKLKIHESWSPKIKKSLEKKGKKISESRLQKVSEMAHVRKVYEQLSTLGNTPGRGDFAFGNNPADGASGFYGEKGNSEAFTNLFNVFTEVAATNIGMELLPTIVMTKSSGMIYIVEPIYAGGKVDSASDKPLVFQVKTVKTGAAPALVIGQSYTVKTAATGGQNLMDVVYVGSNRLNGNAIFKVGQQYDNTASGGTNHKSEVISTILDSDVNDAGIYISASVHYQFDGGIDYVAGFTNFIAGFSGAGTNDTSAWRSNRGDGSTSTQPMSRQTGEKTYYRNMGVRTWSRNFSAETVQVDINYTTEQIQDMRMDHGFDVVEFGDEVMVDQLNQHMNDHILGEMFAHGWSHHYAMNKINGFNLNAFIGSAANTGAARTFEGKEGSQLTIAGPSGVLPSTGAISENLSSLQRRVVSRLLYASGIINNRSRRGRGDLAVMNTTFVTALKDIRGYVPQPFESNLNDSGLAVVGDLMGMKVFEDNLMDLSDERILVGRKGDEKSPGLKFAPYILSESIKTIAENTLAPKHALKSRYAIVPAGTNPELNYLSFNIQTDSGYSII